MSVFAEPPADQRKDSGEARKAAGMIKADATVVRGVLHKKVTVGYRSPYVLVTGDSQEFEIRESDRVPADRLARFIGQHVEITGRRVSIPPTKAPPGSEAESRFVDGMIPGLEYIETRSVRLAKRSGGPGR
jgi:hypothetical protein